MMAVENVCPDCGTKQPPNAPAGLCPHCLLRLGLDPEFTSATSRRAPARGGRSAAAAPAEAARPRNGRAGAKTPPPSGILTTLNLTIGPVPRVLLRDSPADEPRPVRPGSEEMPNLAGDPGRYQLLGEIARGGIGAILKGRDVDLGRDLAVKVLLEKHRDHPEMIRRFIEEAQIGGQLQHPGIVPVHELGQFPDGRLYIAMKLVRGRTLAVLLEGRKDPAEDRPRFLSIFEQVCQTMAYAHARGVVHRDLKPSNIMVGNFGEVQVMDWGLAKVLEQGGVADEEKARLSRAPISSTAIRTVRTGSEAAESRAGSILGTPAYMAPEQARGALDTVDERADVFGLGSILCEVLTGHPAFTGESSAELQRKAERADLSDAHERLAACGGDPELVALVRSCLSPAPKDRPRDAGVVLAGLTAYLAGVERRLRAAELAKAKAEARAAGERKRRVLTASLAASMLATMLVAWGGWAWTSRREAGRVARATDEVNKAIDEASQYLGQARSRPNDPVPWVRAIEASKLASTLLERGEVRPELRSRILALQGAIVHERERAEAAAKDQRIVERLAEIHNDFGVHLVAERADSDYAEAFRAYGVDVDKGDPEYAGALLAGSPVAAELANALDQWAFIRRGAGPRGEAGARRLIAIAKVADPDPWRNQLRDTLGMMRRDRPWEARERLEGLAATADPEHLPEASVTRLAFALGWLGGRDTAISLLRRTQRVHPNDFWVNCDLGRELMQARRFGEASRFYSVAVAIRPQSPLALHFLSDALYADGRLDEAAATLGHGLRLRPEDKHARVLLGAILLDLGRPDRAAAEFRKAKDLAPDDGGLRNEIARVLSDRGDWDAAIAELREAAAHEPDDARAHDELGLALLETGRYDDAIASFRLAANCDPRAAFAYDHLGRALLARGEFRAALEELRRGHYGSPKGEPGSPSERRVRDAERLVALEGALPDVLKGSRRPSGAPEAAELARLCEAKRHYATAARLWAEALAAQPKLADDPRANRRYHAACSAALAGRGQGRDDPPPDPAARARLRAQALGWLEEELDAYARQLEGERPWMAAAIPRLLGRWRVDPALAGVRDEPALAALPEPEHRAWRALWARAAELQSRARGHVHAIARRPPFEARNPEPDPAQPPPPAPPDRHPKPPGGGRPSAKEGPR